MAAGGGDYETVAALMQIGKTRNRWSSVAGNDLVGRSVVEPAALEKPDTVITRIRAAETCRTPKSKRRNPRRSLGLACRVVQQLVDLTFQILRIVGSQDALPVDQEYSRN
jgi:hypothetical protein